MKSILATLIWFILMLFFTLYWLREARKIPPLSYRMVNWMFTYVIVFIASVVVLLVAITYFMIKKLFSKR